MGKFAISTASTAPTTSTTAKTVIAISPDAAGEVGECVEVVMTGSGVNGATDIQHRCSVHFCTFAGTGTSTAVTPEPFHQGARASQFIRGCNHSAEPTSYSAQPSVFFGFNQRGGMRWAVPQGEGLHMVGGFDDEGLGVLVTSSAAGNVDAHLHYWEQG